MEISDFTNEKYHELSEDDILICTIGYEERSSFLLESNIITRNKDNTLVVFFDDFVMADWFEETNKKLLNLEIPTEVCSYDQSNKFIQIVIDKINNCDENANIYIDYSSIPRNWYCGLLLEINTNKDKVKSIPLHFYYTAGNYPKKYTACGIGSLECFVGQMLPSMEPNKMHIIALGYDVKRTQSLISKIEPDSLLTCYAFTKQGSKKQIESVNKEILSRVTGYVSLRLDDFVDMMSKLQEQIIEQTRHGQVVIIPDGPKPLILAMSMISLINSEKKKPVVCLHVSRNDNLLESHKVRVTASKKPNDIYCVRFNLNHNSTVN